MLVKFASKNTVADFRLEVIFPYSSAVIFSKPVIKFESFYHYFQFFLSNRRVVNVQGLEGRRKHNEALKLDIAS